MLLLFLGCMVCIGKSNYFRFNHPKEAKRIRENNPGNRFSVMPDKYYPGRWLACPVFEAIAAYKIRNIDKNSGWWQNAWTKSKIFTGITI